MSQIHKGLENSSFKEPENIVHATVCRTSGLLATDKCSNTYSEIFTKDHVPETCDAHKSQYTICTESGKLANEFCPSKERKSANYVVEKERLGLWTTSGINSTMGSAPTEYCTIHKKSTETVKPTTPNTSTEVTTEKPSSGNNEQPTTPDTQPTEPEIPDTPDTPNTPSTPDSGNTGDSNNTGDTTENNDNSE